MMRFIMRRFTSFFAEIGLLPKLYQHNCFLILFENQIQTASTSPCRTQVQPAASFLVCSLIFIEYKIRNFIVITLSSKKSEFQLKFAFFKCCGFEVDWSQKKNDLSIISSLNNQVQRTFNNAGFTTFKPQVFLSCYLKFLVFVYKQYYNNIVVKKEGVLMWKKYFSKYKWTDLFWILFVILTCLLAGNSNLYPLTHQEISYHGCLLGITLALNHLLFIDKFVISNRK